MYEGGVGGWLVGDTVMSRVCYVLWGCLCHAMRLLFPCELCTLLERKMAKFTTEYMNVLTVHYITIRTIAENMQQI